MFVKQMDCTPIPSHTIGVVLCLHRPSKKYFLNTSNCIQRYIRGLKQFLIQQENGSHAFLEFKQLAVNSTLDDWEFYYSAKPNSPLPQEIQRTCTYVYSNLSSDAVINKSADKAIFRVEHKNTIFPIYVVDKSCAGKKSVVRKAISQLKKYTNAGERAWFAQYVCKDPQVFHRALDVFECSLERLGRHSIHDIRYEPVHYDAQAHVTHASAVAQLNLDALMEWKHARSSLQ